MPTRNQPKEQILLWDKMIKELENFKMENLIIGEDLNVYIKEIDGLNCSEISRGSKLI